MSGYVTYGMGEGVHMARRRKHTRKVHHHRHMGMGDGLVMGGEGLIMGGLTSGGLRSGGKGTKVGAAKNPYLIHLKTTGKHIGYTRLPAKPAPAHARGKSPAQREAQKLFAERVAWIRANGMSTRDKTAWAHAKRVVY